MAGQPTGTGVQPLLDLCLLKERLNKQKFDAEVAIKEASLTEDQLGRNEEQLEELESKHEEALANQAAAQNLVERIQLTTEALRCIFPDISDQESPNTEETEAKSRRLQDLMAQQRTIITDILILRESVAEKKEIHYELRQRNQEMRHQNRQTMLAIKDAANQTQRSSAHKQRVNKAEDELQKVVDRITVLRSVFQAMIVGSGMNWAQDPELLDLVVSLSQQPDLDT